MDKKNRLSSLFEDYANRFELPHQFDKDFKKAKLEIPITEEKSITTTFSFDESGDSYEYFVVIYKPDDSDIEKISSEILHNKPIKGITERITQDGKYIASGGRTGLKGLSDSEIQRGLREDLGNLPRILFEGLAGDSTTDAPPPVKKK